jgi:hypothetical protein
VYLGKHRFIFPRQPFQNSFTGGVLNKELSTMPAIWRFMIKNIYIYMIIWRANHPSFLNIVINLWSSSMIKLEFRNVDFCGGRKTGELGEKPLKQGRESTTNSTHIHV